MLILCSLTISIFFLYLFVYNHYLPIETNISIFYSNSSRISEWPAREVLMVALDRFRSELPVKELDRIKIIRSAIGHARKLIYSNDLRKRRQSIPDSSTSASPPVATAGNSKRSRTDHWYLMPMTSYIRDDWMNNAKHENVIWCLINESCSSV